tara:strand:+ start:342 stop:1304 length:963 start_codon:yes stop_codon:yes gene_type:complete
MPYVVTIINLATLNIYKTKEVTGDEYTTFDKFKDQINRCKTILEDCIKNRPSTQPDVKTINIYLGKDGWTSETNTLGEAGNNIIRINQWNTGDYYLNDTVEHQNISVIIHEIFHIFGLFPNSIDGNIENITYYINDVDTKTRRIYKGANGLNGYKKVLLANNITVPDPIYICLEDDFGEGTVNVHLEEAYNSSSDRYEVIKITDPTTGVQFYPSLYNEIMSGLLDRINNYITPITMGCLEDFGYTINYKSPYIVTNGTNMNFVANEKSKQMGTEKNYITLDEDIYDISYLNKVLKGGEVNNINILSEMVIEKWGQKIPSR